MYSMYHKSGKVLKMLNCIICLFCCEIEIQNAGLSCTESKLIYSNIPDSTDDLNKVMISEKLLSSVAYR